MRPAASGHHAIVAPAVAVAVSSPQSGTVRDLDKGDRGFPDANLSDTPVAQLFVNAVSSRVPFMSLFAFPILKFPSGLEVLLSSFWFPNFPRSLSMSRLEPKARSALGFTLIELLVVIAIIATLIASAASGRPSGPRGGPPQPMPQQPEAIRHCHAQLPRRRPHVPDGSVGVRQQLGFAGLPFFRATSILTRWPAPS